MPAQPQTGFPTPRMAQYLVQELSCAPGLPKGSIGLPHHEEHRLWHTGKPQKALPCVPHCGQPAAGREGQVAYNLRKQILNAASLPEPQGSVHAVSCTDLGKDQIHSEQNTFPSSPQRICNASLKCQNLTLNYQSQHLMTPITVPLISENWILHYTWLCLN